MNIVNIPSINVDDVWSLVKKDISEALSYSGNHTDAKFVYDTVKENKMQLWVIWDKSKPTTIEKYSPPMQPGQWRPWDSILGTCPAANVAVALHGVP